MLIMCKVLHWFLEVGLHWVCLSGFTFVRFVVHGLVPGDTYVFRVQAVNAYGLSEESQESAPLFIDAALCTYTTDFYSNVAVLAL